MTRVLLNLLAGDPDHLSGIAVYALRQMEALLRRGQHDYSLLTSWPRDRLAEHLPLDNVTYIHGVSPRSEKVNFVTQNWQVWRAAQRVDAQTVFTPWPLAPSIGGERRVLVVHDLYRQTHPELHSWHFRLGWKLMFPLAVRRSARIVAVSDATAADFTRLYPEARERTCTVREASTLRATPRPDRPWPSPYALSVSTTAATKNLPGLIAGLDALHQRGTSLDFLWVGKDDGTVAKALADHPAVDRFHSLGRVDEETLATLYAHADFYVAASLTEGFCLPIVEAQKYGVPVACSDIPVLREVAGDGAIYFNPRDPQAIADAIGKLTVDPALRAELGAKASHNSLRFSWDKSAEALEAIFAG